MFSQCVFSISGRVIQNAVRYLLFLKEGILELSWFVQRDGSVTELGHDFHKDHASLINSHASLSQSHNPATSYHDPWYNKSVTRGHFPKAFMFADICPMLQSQDWIMIPWKTSL